MVVEALINGKLSVMDAQRKGKLSVAEAYSPVEIEILLGKNTINQINSLSYTEFFEEYENDLCQVVSFGEEKL